jgi:hypothetical protein
LRSDTFRRIRRYVNDITVGADHRTHADWAPGQRAADTGNLGTSESCGICCIKQFERDTDVPDETIFAKPGA